VSVGRLGSVAGPLVAGQVLAAGAGVAGVMIAASPGLVVAAVCALKLSRLHAPSGRAPQSGTMQAGQAG
jgi:AAHS family 3-hydroxyphenylpropionic acid transporter